MNKSQAPIATPCGASWEEMTPDSGARLCATCDKLVHDLSSMTEQRARRLLASKENLCVRYLFDEHGNIWFSGETPPLVTRLLNRAKRGAVAAAAIAAPLVLQACMGAALADDVPYVEVDAGSDDAGRFTADAQVSNDDASSDEDAASDADVDSSDDGGDAGD